MFSDTNSEAPSPLNESAATSKPTDIPSSRYLFQLAVLEPRTEETECLLLPTPLVVEREHPDRVEALKATGATRINSRANGEQRPNGLIDFMQFYDMLPTPRANIVNDMDLNNEKLATRNKGNLEEAIAKAVCFLKTPCAADSYTDTMKSRGVSGTSGTLAQEIVNGYAEKHRGLMLPTPTATEGEKYTNTYNPNSQMGKSLSAMAGSSMLPTPVTQDYKKRGPNSQQQQLGELVYELANGSRDSKEAEKIVGVGQTSRLSPLFTEEMMGFPFLWTALPFLSESGEQNPSKPTATP